MLSTDSGELQPVRTALVASLVEALRAIFERAADAIPPTVLERHAQMLEQQRALEERVRPRSLTSEHALVLARHLKRVVGGTPAIGIAAAAFDAESDAYATAIANCCIASGWDAHKNQLLLASVSGLAVAVVRPEALPGEAIALMDAFRELGIACPAVAYSKVQNQIGFDLDKAPAGTVLLVGKKS